MDYQFHYRSKIPVTIEGADTDFGRRLAYLLKHHRLFQVGEEPGAMLFSVSPKVTVSTGKGGPEVTVIADVNGNSVANLPREGTTLSHPSAAVTAVTLALKPLEAAFGLVSCQVVTLLPAETRAVASLDVIDNVLPVDDKITEEVAPFLSGAFSSQSYLIAQRTSVVQHVSVTLQAKPSPSEVIQCWQGHSSLIHYSDKQLQPKLQRSICSQGGIAVGLLKAGGAYDYQFTLLSDAYACGPVGGAIRNAELLVRSGLVFW